jgi:hypothetical protein
MCAGHGMLCPYEGKLGSAIRGALRVRLNGPLITNHRLLLTRH